MTGSEHFIHVGRVEDFPEGALVQVRIGNVDVAVCSADGRLHAFSDFCTHEAVSFTSGYGVVIEGKVLCMLHTSVFDLDTGEVLGGPADAALSTYSVEVRGDEVFIAVK